MLFTINNRICYHISNTTGAKCAAGSAYHSGAPEITPSFWWGSCCLFFSFLCCVMCTIVCLFVIFIFSHGVFSLSSIYEFDCPFGIFRPSSITEFVLTWATRHPCGAPDFTLVVAEIRSALCTFLSYLSTNFIFLKNWTVALKEGRKIPEGQSNS